MRVGIDIGGTNIKAGLVNEKGDVVSRVLIDTEAQEPPKITIQRIVEIVSGFEKVEKVGVGVPGLVKSRHGLVQVCPNLPLWKDVPLTSELEKRLDCPVAIGNDVNVMAWGEMAFGAGRGKKDVFFLTLGTGLGGAVVLGGKLFLGKDETAGEIGHFTLRPGGVVCACGNDGCLEQYVAKNGIIRLARELSPDHGEYSPKDVADAAREGSEWAQKVFDSVARDLAQVLSGMVQIFNFESFVIGGQIAGAGEILFAPLRDYTRKRVYDFLKESFEIVPARLGIDAGIVGAAYFDQVLNGG